MATASILLDKDAFNRLVLEEGLKTWEVGGYVYAGHRGASGYELYRTYGPKWAQIYQARRIWTTGVGGGAININIAVASGMSAQLIGLAVVGPASAGATLEITLSDEDGNALTLASVAAGASRILRLPSIGAAASTHQNLPNSTMLRIGPGCTLTASASASLQNETMTLQVYLLVPIEATASSVTWSNSGATAGTLAPSTISDANTLQTVLLP